MKLELIQPSDWSDITFNQYKRLLKLVISADVNDNVDILKLRLEQMAVLNPDYSVEELGRLKGTQLLEYFKSIDFIDKEPVKEVFNEFVIDGEKFRQIKFNDLSLAQWIDAEKWGNDVLDHNKLLAIFYIDPEKYNDIIRDRVAEFLDNQPCSKVFYLISQFFFIQTALEMALKDYSEIQLKQMEEVKLIIKKAQQIDKRFKKVQKWFGFKSSTI
jgi:hypothetical protein